MSYIGSTPTTQSFIAGTDYFNGTGSAVSFTMSRAVNSVNDIEVIVNNVEQIPSGYSVSGTTLTFSAAPSAGTSNVYVRYLSTTNLSLAIPAGTSATFNTVTVADGSATTPSITNDGDTNTGIFFPAADTIAFSEGGVEAVRIDASGNVGIGTSSPYKRLNATKASSTAYSASDFDIDSLALQLANTTNDKSTGIYFAIGSNGEAAISAVETSDGETALTFGTRGSGSRPERARIDSSGNLLVGTTSVLGASAAGTTHINGGANDANEAPLYLRNQFSTAGRYWKVGPTNNAGFIIFTDSNTGQYQSYGATSWTATSDERLKTNLLPIENAAQKISSLRAVTGRYKTDEQNVSRSFLIAQDVQAVFPEAVDVQDDEQNTLGLRYTEVIPLLVAAIQEQQALITALTTRITALENNNATQ